MPWRAIDPQPVRVLLDGVTVEASVDRWEDFTGAISGPAADPSAPRFTVLAGEYTPLDEAAFEQACTAGARI